MKFYPHVFLGFILMAPAFVFADSSTEHLQAQLNALQSRVNSLTAVKGDNSSSMFVHTNAIVSYSMMNNQNGVDRELMLLNARKNDSLGQGFYIGGFLDASAIYNKVSDVAVGSIFQDKFSHANNGTGTASVGNTSATASQVLIPRLEMNFIADMNAWVTGYFSLKANNISGSSSDSLSIDDAYFILGNLKKMPVYVFAGHNTINFGRFATVNFNTVPLNRLEFQAFGNEVGFGFSDLGLQVSAAAINDTPGSVTASSLVNNTWTKDGGGIGNFSANASYGRKLQNLDWRVGASYLLGSKRKYVTGSRNPTGAWDLNANLTINSLQLLGEYTSTVSQVDAYNNKLKAWDLGASYGFKLNGNNMKVNCDYSKVKVQYSAIQWVLGVQQKLASNAWVGLEYDYGKGALGGENSVYKGGISAYGFPLANTGITNNTLLLDIQGVF